MGKLAILHTNDLHSHFESWYKIKKLFNERKAQLEKEGYHVIVVDVGDFSDRVHPLTEATNMLYNIKQMNELYDYVTFGNNEGIGNTKEQLLQLYEAFHGKCVMSHCIDINTKQRPDCFSPMVTFTLDSGETIGLMGGTALYPKSYFPLGWDLKEAIPCFQWLYHQYKSSVDHFILLSHFGKYTDKEIAEACPFFDVIIGGHTHHLYEYGKWINGVLLTSCQKHGHYCGEITMDLSEQHYEAKTYAMDHYLLDEEETEKVMAEIEEGHCLLRKKQVGVCDEELSSMALLYGTAKTLSSHYHLPVLLHDGLFVEPLKKGEVTLDDWHRILPHPLHLATVRLDGENMKRLLFEIDKNRHFLNHFHLVGMGFRGKYFGQILFDGVEKINGQWFVQGHPLQAEETYTFLTLDHYEFVPFFPTIAYAGKTSYIMDGFFRNKIASLTDEIVTYGKEFYDGRREKN